MGKREILDLCTEDDQEGGATMSHVEELGVQDIIDLHARTMIKKVSSHTKVDDL